MKTMLLIVFLLALVTSVQAQTPKRTIAVTIDDLPYIAIGEGDWASTDIVAGDVAISFALNVAAQ